MLAGFKELGSVLPAGQVIRPIAKNTAYYRKHYEILKKLYLTNKDIMHELRNE